MSLEKKEKIDPEVQKLFCVLEPLFENIYVSTKRFSPKERAIYQQIVYECGSKCGSNFYESFILLFKERIKQGFQSSLAKLKEKRNEEGFNLIVEKKLNHLKYGKEIIFTLFWCIDKAKESGASLTDEMIYSYLWEEFITSLNQTFQLNLHY